MSGPATPQALRDLTQAMPRQKPALFDSVKAWLLGVPNKVQADHWRSFGSLVSLHLNQLDDRQLESLLKNLGTVALRKNTDLQTGNFTQDQVKQQDDHQRYLFKHVQVLKQTATTVLSERARPAGANSSAQEPRKAEPSGWSQVWSALRPLEKLGAIVFGIVVAPVAVAVAVTVSVVALPVIVGASLFNRFRDWLRPKADV